MENGELHDFTVSAVISLFSSTQCRCLTASFKLLTEGRASCDSEDRLRFITTESVWFLLTDINAQN